jgi:hypothetical protein
MTVQKTLFRLSMAMVLCGSTLLGWGRSLSQGSQRLTQFAVVFDNGDAVTCGAFQGVRAEIQYVPGST